MRGLDDGPKSPSEYALDMFTTDLSYVRDQLGKLTPTERSQVAKKNKLHPKTLRRILGKKTKGPRSDTIGKLLMHFRTQEQRRRA
jgi:hypothetical protein